MSRYMDSSLMSGLGRRRVYRRRRVGGVAGGRRRRVYRHRRYGRGFFGDLWSGIKSVAPSVLRATGVLSKAANLIPYVGGPASALIRSQGYGRRRRRVRRRRVMMVPIGHGRRRRRVTHRRRRVGRGLLL